MTTSCFDREDETFILLINRKLERSIWPHWKAVPGGWIVVEGVKGDKKTVLEYVDKTWTDQRPLSLRKWMAEQDGDAEALGKCDRDEKEWERAASSGLPLSPQYDAPNATTAQ